MTDFSDRVLAHFGDLMAENGFALVGSDSTVGELVAFKREPLTLTVGWYKDEIEESFWVDLQFAAGHGVFRPYISREFPVQELVLRANPEAYEDLARFASIRTLSQADLVLARHAEIVKRYCSPILAGDLSQLEAITMERRGKHRA